MISIRIILWLFVILFGNQLLAQNSNHFQQIIEQPRDFRAMFYNCENYFDTINDPLKNDDEFTPNGSRFWSSYKFWQKSLNLSKVIVATGGWKPVDIIGLCEIENYQVLEVLTKQTPLYKNNYQIVHFESPDTRGIDVALLYRDETFKLISKRAIDISSICDFSRPTRDILYVKGVAVGIDTLHVFVNHWPSRWGGQLESESNRMDVAKALRGVTDSILNENPEAKLLIMGDMNDEAHNRSIYDVLGADDKAESTLNNLMLINKNTFRGSYKYQGNWAIIDHIITSKALIKESTFYVNKSSVKIVEAGFLMEEDAKYLGNKPFRTFSGYRYNGGYSDHLPIFIDFYKGKTPKP